MRISSVQSLSHIQLFETPWTTTRQASLSIINSQSLLKLMSIQPSHPLLSPSPPASIRVFSNESVLHIQVAKVQEFQLQHQSLQ